MFTNENRNNYLWYHQTNSLGSHIFSVWFSITTSILNIPPPVNFTQRENKNTKILLIFFFMFVWYKWEDQPTSSGILSLSSLLRQPWEDSQLLYFACPDQNVTSFIQLNVPNTALLKSGGSMRLRSSMRVVCIKLFLQSSDYNVS